MLKKFGPHYPSLGSGVYMQENTLITGDVIIGDDVSIFSGANIRGDVANITIGNSTNIQESATIHCSHDMPTIIGHYVTIGHNAVVHSAKIGNNTLIGMGAIILDDVEIGENCLVAAGSVVTPRSKFGPNQVIVGNPAKMVKDMCEDRTRQNMHNAVEYVMLKNQYMEEEINENR